MSTTHHLSQLDAFFVAYQEAAQIAMQLGVELELDREVPLGAVRDAVGELLDGWPRLGQRLRRQPLGLAWVGEPDLPAMVHEGDPGERLAWRNRTLDPFVEPPLQVLLTQDGGRSLLAFRAHHAVADGESLFMLVWRVLGRLAGVPLVAGGEGEGGEDLADLLPWRRIVRGGHLPHLVRYAGWLARESRAGRSAGLALRSRDVGDVAVCDEHLDAEATRDLQLRARELGVSPAMLLCAAWVRSIGRWNREHGAGDNPLVSLELPVSLRRGAGAAARVGNFISPVLLFADSSQTPAAVARDLRKQVRDAIRQRSYLAMPMLTSPARYLPWPLFRRTATDTTFSGFATSHFSWFEQAGATREAWRHRSLELRGQAFYTPVCLHMGAAMSALLWDDRLQVALTHRLPALGPRDARQLLDTALEEALAPRELATAAVAASGRASVEAL